MLDGYVEVPISRLQEIRDQLQEKDARIKDLESAMQITTKENLAMRDANNAIAALRDKQAADLAQARQLLESAESLRGCYVRALENLEGDLMQSARELMEDRQQIGKLEAKL